MMNGNVRMMGGIAKVGGECVLQTEPFLSHFYFVSRENYEMHVVISFRRNIRRTPPSQRGN